MNKLTLTFFILFITIQLHAQTGLQITTICQDTLVCLPTNECDSTTFSISFAAITDCNSPDINFNFEIDWDDDGVIDLVGNTASINSNFPKGTHRILFVANDSCGQLDSCEMIVQINDCEAPTIVCPFGIPSVTIPTIGYIEIPANQIVSNTSFDNCTHFENLIFTFSTDINDTLLNISCADYTSPCVDYVDDIDDFRPVTLFVHDEAGNIDSCTTFIHITAPLGMCESILSGSSPNIICYTPAADTLNLQYKINSTFGFSYTYLQPWCTIIEGDTITPLPDCPTLNGVTTYDLVLIKKHILGTQLFDNYYKEVAADVNNSGTVTLLDIVIIKSRILQITTEFPGGENMVFDPPYIINDITQTDLDFVGIKLGDVNYTAIFDSLQNSQTEIRTDRTLNFYAKNQILKKGKTYTIPTFARNFDKISGMQFTIDFDEDALEFQNIITQNLVDFSTDDFGLTQVEKGIILCSWASASPQKLASNQAIYNITFTAKKDGQLSDFLNINSSQINSEAYVEKEADLELWKMKLEFDEVSKSADKVTLFPNPFSEKTNLIFSLEKEQVVTIQFFDINGRLIFSHKKNRNMGENQLEIKKEMLSNQGIYFYKIETLDKMMSGRFILK